MKLFLVGASSYIERIKTNNLTTGDRDLFVGMIEFNAWLQFSLQEKNISINKLQKIFGSGSERRNKKKRNNSASGKSKNKTDDQSSLKEETAAPEHSSETTEDIDHDVAAEPATESTTNVRNYVPNSGRLGYEAYMGAEKIIIDAPYKIGDQCPEMLCGGKLYTYEPGNVIKITGQSFAKATHYEIETLRCNLCGTYFNSDLPIDVCAEKYDPAFKAQLCVYKHFLGVPNYRLESYQEFIGVPLPDSTQFDKTEDVANAAHPVFKQMEQFAANGHLAHGDDTSVKIQSLIKENKSIESNVRKGMFTTGIVSFYEEYQIHLFYSGRLHCGENMLALLAKRDPSLPPIKYMCDALGRNMPASLKAIIINCLIHGRRNFTDIDKFFPQECAVVVDVIAEIYKYDGEAREQSLDDEQRLKYHQTHSAAPMEGLWVWMQKKLDEHVVEPNSSLGKAFNYMLKHWEKLTQFLRIAGAPLDNNIIERALKLPIRVRKNSLFYATEHGAYIGSMLQSIICTCIAQSVNPVDYLVALQVHKVYVRLNPSAWMPWNYKDAIAARIKPILAQAA